MTLERHLEEIKSEFKRQDILYGEQNHTPLKWVSILVKQVGSVAEQANKFDDAGKDLNLQKYESEAIQVAAVAIRMLQCLERGKWSDTV